MIVRLAVVTFLIASFALAFSALVDSTRQRSFAAPAFRTDGPACRSDGFLCAAAGDRRG